MTGKFINTRELPALLMITAAHGAALYVLAEGVTHPEPPKLPETITAVMLPPKVLPVEPAPAEPKPQPQPRQQPTVKLRPSPVPLPPIPNAPPSPNAISSPPPEPPQSPQPQQVAKAEAPPVPAPVEQPRSDAQHLNNQMPAYPSLSRKLGEQGRVLLSVYILADGTVGEIKLKKSSGFDRLDDAALNAVKRWKYVPAKQAGVPINYWFVQPFDWSLNS